MGGERTLLFVALALAEELGEALCALTGPVLAGHLRTYPPRDLHLTLHFLGAVPAEDVDSVAARLEAEVEGLAPPALAIDRTGCFPPRGEPRIWWARAVEQGGAVRLDAVFAAVERALLPPEERSSSWTPHLTLARTPRRGGRGLAELKARFLELRPSLDWRPEGITLVESRPDRPERRYRPVAAWPFREGGASSPPTGA